MGRGRPSRVIERKAALLRDETPRCAIERWALDLDRRRLVAKSSSGEIGGRVIEGDGAHRRPHRLPHRGTGRLAHRIDLHTMPSCELWVDRVLLSTTAEALPGTPADAGCSRPLRSNRLGRVLHFAGLEHRTDPLPRRGVATARETGPAHIDRQVDARLHLSSAPEYGMYFLPMKMRLRHLSSAPEHGVRGPRSGRLGSASVSDDKRLNDEVRSVWDRLAAFWDERMEAGATWQRSLNPNRRSSGSSSSSPVKRNPRVDARRETESSLAV